MRRVLAFACALLVVASCTTDRTRRGYLRANAARFTAPPAHPVVVIPGFGVTRLFDPETGRFVWGTPRTAMRTVWADDLDLPFDPVTLEAGRDRLVPRGFAGSRGPINTAWQLTIALEKFGGYTTGRDVYPFDYDWRLGALENAARLDAFVADIRRRHGGATVDVVTHSAGGIVALAWVKGANGATAVRNLVLLAPPERGVVEAFRMFVRPERFIRRTFHPAVVATWPSVAELLPEDGRIFLDESGHPWTSISGRPQRGSGSASSTRRLPPRSREPAPFAVLCATRRCRREWRCTSSPAIAFRPRAACSRAPMVRMRFIPMSCAPTKSDCGTRCSSPATARSPFRAPQRQRAPSSSAMATRGSRPIRASTGRSCESFATDLRLLRRLATSFPPRGHTIRR